MRREIKKPHSLGSGGKKTQHLSKPEEIKINIQSGFLASGSIYFLRLPTKIKCSG
jgi:hypothetical protein